MDDRTPAAHPRSGAPHDRLRVSPDGHHLVRGDGSPFFWLADTAWAVRRLTPTDVDTYLETRAQQGFNVIQIAPASTAGYAGPDHAGHWPFVGGDAAKPDSAFWANIDSIVERAAGRFHVAIFPLWGGDYQRLFASPTKAYQLGLWLGKRYADVEHVVWSVSGEYDAINGFNVPITPAQRGILVAAAEGLRSATHARQLITIHPGVARSSSVDFHTEPWLDFDMLQSGHAIDWEARGHPEVYTLVAHDRALLPTKPVLDGESIYEDTPDAVWETATRDGPRAGADVIRRKAYWSVFAGACGHTYGHNDVFALRETDHPGEISSDHTDSAPRGSWRTSLHAPGAWQMRHLRNLMEAHPSADRGPDQSVLTWPSGTMDDRVRASRSSADGDILIYLPAGGDVSVDLGSLDPTTVIPEWFDPSTGESTAADPVAIGADRMMRFSSPVGLGLDRVLVLCPRKPGHRRPNSTGLAVIGRDRALRAGDDA